jgi:hypothetical protein
MNKKTIEDIDVKGKKVLVRVDFNVPLSSKDPNDEITVTDDNRIRAALPTLNYLLDEGAALILCSHLGRPSSPDDKQFAMDPVAMALSDALQRPVIKVDEVVGESVTEAVADLERRVRCCCWKTPASIPARRRMTSSCRANWPIWPMFMSTTPLARPIVPTPARKGWPR